MMPFQQQYSDDVCPHQSAAQVLDLLQYILEFFCQQIGAVSPEDKYTADALLQYSTTGRHL